MRKLSRTLMLLILAVSLICSFGLVANAATFESAEDAIGFLDSYADNVGVDENFSANISVNKQ